MSDNNRKDKTRSRSEGRNAPGSERAWYSRFIQRQSDGSYYFVFNAREVEQQTERRMIRSLTLAEDAMQSRDFATAVRYYRTFLRYDPAQVQVHTRLAMAELRLGNTAAAIESAETALELNPDSSEAAITLAICQSEAGNLALAESLLVSLKDNPSIAFRVHMELGRLYTKWQRLDKSLESFRQAAMTGVPTAELHLEMGQVLFSLEQFDAAVVEFEHAVALKPTDGFALNCLAVTYSTIGKYDEANVSFRSAIEIEPENAEYRNNLGINCSHQKKYAAAAECFREAIFLDDEQNIYHMRLARVLAAAKQNDEALSAITKCLEREPANIEALVLSGDVLVRLRLFEDAIDRYDRAVTIQPDGNLYRKMGRIRLRLMQSQKAKECFMHAARIEPDSVLNFTCMGFVALLEGQLDNAMRLFTQAVAMDPVCDEAYLGLSKTLTELGDIEEAESAIKTAIHCAPNNIEALVHYALIREKYFDPKTAIRCYKRALTLDPANVEALLRCARVLHQEDQRTEAMEYARRALEWNPQSTDAHYHLAELYIEEGRLALGLIHTRELFALQPEEHRRFINIAMTLERVKAMDKAIEVYKRLTDIDGECAEAYFHMGRLAYEGGLLKLSMEVQEKLDEMSPEFARLLKKFRDQSLPAVDIAYIEGSSSDLVSAE